MLGQLLVLWLLKSRNSQSLFNISIYIYPRSISKGLLSVIWDTGSTIPPLSGLPWDPSPSTRLGSGAGPQGPVAQKRPRHGLEQDQSPLDRIPWTTLRKRRPPERPPWPSR